MDYLQNLIIQIELHSVEGIRECFENGINPNQWYNGKPLIEELVSEYTRTSRFKDCVRVFMDYGLQFEDNALLAVLLDDSLALEKLVENDPGIIFNTCNLRCAYTPMENVSLLHVCAEFNHLSCAKVLMQHGADINARAGTDEYGFGGQTPIFHTVNQNNNQSKQMLDYLLSQDADLSIAVKGLVWGKGYEWETLIPAVNPTSYAMMGLLPQMHRSETTINETVLLLLNKQYGISYPLKNVPNRYLKH